jgi:hypothetical protein
MEARALCEPHGTCRVVRWTWCCHFTPSSFNRASFARPSDKKVSWFCSKPQAVQHRQRGGPASAVAEPDAESATVSMTATAALLSAGCARVPTAAAPSRSAPTAGHLPGCCRGHCRRSGTNAPTSICFSRSRQRRPAKVSPDRGGRYLRPLIPGWVPSRWFNYDLSHPCVPLAE